MGDRTAPGAGVASVATSTAPEGWGLVLVWLILVAAVVNLNRSVAKVVLPDVGKVVVADGWLLVHPSGPPIETSIAMVEQPTLGRGSCRGVVGAP
jgi:hypothetical protein